MCFGCISGKKYSITELCDVQDGSVRISLEQGSYVQLDLAVDLDGPGTSCEIVIQTTHKDDGLLIYFENFDFVGTNLATVFRRQDCGASLMRLWDGEFHYLSSCVGDGLKEAPPMSTFSSLGAVKLQLLPANMTGPGAKRSAGETSAKPIKKPPINFSVIATASQKASASNDCPSGCCRDPYNFRCPLLSYCIDVKLTCNNVTNCGPSVGTTQDENGPMCAALGNSFEGGVIRVVQPTDVQRVVTADDDPDIGGRQGNMLRPVWAHGTDTGFGDVGNTEVTRSFYTRVELVCGIVSIILFCLAGLGVLVCRSRRSSSASALYGSSSDSLQTVYVPSGSEVVSPSVAAALPLPVERSSDARPRTASGGTRADRDPPRAKYEECQCCSRNGGESGSGNGGVYIIGAMGIHHAPCCPKHLPDPPPYESLFPKDNAPQTSAATG